MQTIKLVVFDLAGTTIFDDGSIAICFQQAMQQFGYQVPVQEINPLMGYKKPQAIAMMLAVHEPDINKQTEQLVHDIHLRFEQNMIAYYEQVPTIQPLPHAEEVLIALKKAGIKIGLNTGFSKAIADVIVHRLGWLYHGLADYIVASDEVEAGRPHPFMIQKMMELAGITDAQQVVKVGDTEVDVNEGKNAGCLYAIGVTTGAFSRAQLAPYEPSYIIDDLSELLPILQVTA